MRGREKKTMRGFCLCALVSVVLLHSSLPSSAAIIRVPADFATVQAAIDAASDGDEIIVSPGIYPEHINFKGKNIILRSIDPTSPTVVANTILDGQHSGFRSVVTFDGTESSTCVLAGFTICNGWAESGGGICGNGTHATIENNVIRDNLARGPSMMGDGGGIWRCDGLIQNNIIWNNYAAGYGGGLENCRGIIQNNVIYANGAIAGGGVDSGLAIIRNCIIWNNDAIYGDPNVRRGQPTYCCIQGWQTGTGIIGDDPKFIDPENGDFHLAHDSPCIDAGCSVPLSVDFEGDPRPYDGTPEPRGDGSDFDIGVDEATQFFRLAVISDYDSPVPSGTTYQRAGTITAYIEEPVIPVDTGVQIRCLGWVGEGSVPSSGTEHSVTFALDQPSTITWLWRVECQLVASAEPPSLGSVTLADGTTPASGWHEQGSTVTVLAVPLPGSQFLRWSGDLHSGANPDIIRMDGPREITAIFTPYPSLRTRRWNSYR